MRAERLSSHDLEPFRPELEGSLRPRPDFTAERGRALPDGIEQAGLRLAVDPGFQRGWPGLQRLSTEFDLVIWKPRDPRQEFRDEAAKARPFTPIASGTDAATVDAKLQELEDYLEATQRRALLASNPKLLDPFGGSGDGGFTPIDRRGPRELYYKDIHDAMTGDLNDLAGWQSKTTEEKIALYNRVAHEANIEVKHNVNLVSVDKTWDDRELDELEAGLSKLPRSLVLDNTKIHSIERHQNLGGNTALAQQNGVIQISDLGAAKGSSRYDGAQKAGVTFLTELVIHELGHYHDNENPQWKEWQALSGWRRLGDAGVHADKPSGTEVKGKDVGITDDPEGDYIVRRNGSDGVWVHKKDAAFSSQTEYGKTDPYEDFAEALSEFILDPDKLKAAAPDKYAFMEKFAVEANLPSFRLLPFRWLLN
jgi:hypothetical protein